MTTIEEPHHAGDAARARWLLTPEAVRARCGQILSLADENALAHFALHRGRLGPCAAYVAETIRQNYPGLEIPFHARWRHFVVNGEDRWLALASAQDWDHLEQARVAFDLAVTSVLLDAGAGPDWSFRDSGGNELNRSEGLAIASLEAFASGLFSSDPENPFRADAAALQQLTAAHIAQAFQVSRDNPLAGLEGRAVLMRSLGDALAARSDLFGADGRIGNLVDSLVTRGPVLPARDILLAVLDGLGTIWTGRSQLAGTNLGDCWRHSHIAESDGFVPFHKLSQWLSYSLIEPLQQAGVEVQRIDELTGLAEYRNGGLFLDMDVLAFKDAKSAARVYEPGHELIVEWRALTVALLDEIAGLVRRELSLPEADFPLAKVLEGGTWAAGRRIAQEMRDGGVPPLNIQSDGSVF